MIPTRLNLHNFLAYRAPNPIVFEGVHLACLTGENGAGKSSLLDAITWAVWGKARARDNDLVHIGTTSMYVELDFLHEGQKYRVTRGREKRGRSGSGRLRLDAYDADGNLNDISEGSINATQKRINAMLRLDYDTFVNSAFLQQGEADAFTVKRPAERKQILSNILGLERWSEYEDRVKEKLREINETLRAFEYRIADIDTQLETEPARKQALADAEAAQQHAKAQLETAEALLKEVENAPADLKRAQTDLQTAAQQRVNYENQLAALLKETETRATEVAKYAAIVENRDAIVEGYEALQQARAASDDLNDKYRQLSDIERSIAALEGQLNEERATLVGEQGALQEQISRLTAQIDEADEAARVRVAAEIEGLEAKVAERDTLKGELNALDTEYATLEATNSALRETMTELKERIDALSAVEGAACPLCGQPLTEEHRMELLEHLQAQGTEQGDTFRANAKRLDEIKAERKVGKKEIETLTVVVQPLPQLQKQMGQLQQQAEAATQASTQRTKQETRLLTVTATLADEAFGGEIRGEIAALTEQRDALGYDEATHDAHKKTLKAYRDYETQHTELSVAESSLPRLEQLQATQHARMADLNADLATLAERTTEIEREVARLQTLAETYTERNRTAMRLRTEAAQTSENVGAARQDFNALDDLRESRKSYEARRGEIAEQRAVYEELRDAFGKNGVPAMVIETAIPELENTTNQLLARITDGRMTVKFSMQREKVTGGTSETLDIEIADELGTRGYDLYSGGEAFRINFAIRVALSKMLARRAGAHLETLFIDEGFGTQDADGRSKLVEAINAIREEFEVVLVITHIDELKDAFPVHIHVEKAANGSQVYLR